MCKSNLSPPQKSDRNVEWMKWFFFCRITLCWDLARKLETIFLCLLWRSLGIENSIAFKNVLSISSPSEKKSYIFIKHHLVWYSFKKIMMSCWYLVVNFQSVLKYRSLAHSGKHFLFLLDCCKYCVDTIIKTITPKM